MILTEAEAVTRWCPFVRLYVFSVPAREALPPSVAGGPANRYIDGAETAVNPDNCRCLATNCMCWIWVDPDYGQPERKGCCGLAHARPGEI